MKLYDNAFSPFARKVRMVLEYKRLDFEVIDGLVKSNHDALAAVNPRLEVPTLTDGETVVVNSADIAAYLEHKFPQKPLYPKDPETRARARSWERTSDSVIDPIVTNISYWHWAERPDTMPAGLKEAAKRDLNDVYAGLEHELAGKEFVCGDLTIADIALFPHLAAVKLLGVEFTREQHPNLFAWHRRMRAIDVCRADLERTRAWVAKPHEMDIERKKIFWRGDRIEWLLARGFHDWFWGEIQAGRVLWPGYGPPAGPLRRSHG